MGVLVLITYLPKPGLEAQFQGLLSQHVPCLRKHGLLTERPTIQATAGNGTVLEVFEWASHEASGQAHHNAEVMALWGRFSEVCDFVPLASVPEAGKPFAHFTPLSATGL